MGVAICPSAVVAAPVENVWELLSEPALYDVWWNARTERIVPEGPATPGQTLYAKTSALGRTWDVTLRVDAVNRDLHQVQLRITLPLGIVNHATITTTAIDDATSRLQFG